MLLKSIRSKKSIRGKFSKQKDKIYKALKEVEGKMSALKKAVDG